MQQFLPPDSMPHLRIVHGWLIPLIVWNTALATDQVRQGMALAQNCYIIPAQIWLNVCESTLHNSYIFKNFFFHGMRAVNAGGQETNGALFNALIFILFFFFMGWGCPFPFIAQSTFNAHLRGHTSERSTHTQKGSLGVILVSTLQILIADTLLTYTSV